MVFLLDDGIAGHQRQAGALAEALQLGPVQSIAVALRLPFRWLSPYWLKPRRNALEQPIRLANGAVVLACGRRAAVAAQALRDLEPGLRLVQILDPGDDLSRYDVVVLPAHDRRRGPNVVLSQLALHDLSPARLESVRLHEAPPVAAAQHPIQLFLIGAPSRHVPWRLPDLIACYQRALGQGSILTCVSRRTPANIRKALAKWHQQHGGPGYFGAGPNPYLQYLAHADVVRVSADSVNMLSEAAATNARLEVLMAEHAHGKLKRFLDSLAATDRLDRTGAAPLYELPQLAQTIRARLGQ